MLRVFYMGLFYIDIVSILTRPEGRVLHNRPQIIDRLIAVSILTRPEGRVLPSKKD